jgi:hypothetical protein
MPNFLEKSSKLPAPLKEYIFSNSAAENNYRICTSFGLDAKGQSKIAKLTGLIFVGDFPLEKTAETLQRELPAPERIATGLSISLIKSIFLPLKEFFPGAELLIQAWSQKAAPPTFQPQSLGIAEEPAESAKAQIETTKNFPVPRQDTIIERNIEAMIAEREDIVNQSVTEKPLKLTDSESQKLPSIKNWLTDWHRYKSYFPEQDIALVRMKYLHESPNGKNLSSQERTVVNFLLKSYDEKIQLPFSQKTGQLMIEKLIQPPPQAVPAQAPRPQIAKPPETPIAPPPAATAPSPPAIAPKPAGQPPSQLPIQPFPSPPPQSAYREPIASQDLAGPQASPRPAPKLNGNVINLKDMNL